MKNPTLLTIFLLLCACTFCPAQKIFTLAASNNGDGKTALQIGICPVSQLTDAAGNIYFAEPDKQIVRKLSTAGIYSTVAGNGVFGYSGDGGPATSARLEQPYNVAVDGSGNLFITDSYKHVIRKVDINGIITTIAGNGTPGFSGDGSNATSAQLNGPNAVAADNNGNIYIADFQNMRVRKVSANGIITTVAGNGAFGNGPDNSMATSASIGYPLGLACNPNNEIFISDVAFGKIRKVSSGGIITTVAGNGSTSFSGDGNLATLAGLSVTGSVALDANGNMFIPDTYNHRVRKVDASGYISTVAGNGSTGSPMDGVAISVPLREPTGVAIRFNDLLITQKTTIRQVNNLGMISTLAGNGSFGTSGNDGNISGAQLFQPDGIALGPSGDIYFATTSDNVLRKFQQGGVVTAFAGNGTQGYGGNGGPAASAQLTNPNGVSLLKAGDFLVTDRATIRKINSNNTISIFAGTGTSGFSGDNGPASSANVYIPIGPVEDSLGNLYFSDRINNRIRKIDTHGNISTIAGNGNMSFSGDGGLAVDAEFYNPSNLAIDSTGNIYVVDAGNSRIRKITTDGKITTIAGNGSTDFSGDDGPATAAGLAPRSIVLDKAGNLFFSGNGRIRRINKHGIVSTVAGGGTNFNDGAKAREADIQPQSLVFNSNGYLVFSEFLNNRIRIMTIPGPDTWTGAVDNHWENPQNWSLNIVPNSDIDVIINTGSVVITSVASARTLKAGTGASITVNSNYSLTILE